MIIKKSEKGAMAIIVAFFFSILFLVLALVIESGYFYSEKQKTQNSVDAAAMAGALYLCNDETLSISKKTLIENLFPEENHTEDQTDTLSELPNNYSLEIIKGFYDENDYYQDFSAYKDFTGENDYDFPQGEYANAVKVSLTIREKLLLGKFGEKDVVDLHVSAVAFRRRIGILAYGNNSNSDIVSSENFHNDQLEFKNMGGLHANGDIKFRYKVKITGNTVVTASGRIINCPAGLHSAETIYDVRPIDWEYLEESAIVFTVDQWSGVYGSVQQDYEVMTENGNSLYHHGNGSPPEYVFGVHPGNHGGVIYYFSDKGADSSAKLYIHSIHGSSSYNASNFTIASELQIDFDSQQSNGNDLTIGGENEKTVFIYSKKNIGNPGPGDTGRFMLNGYKGVVFNTEKNFSAKLGYAFSTNKSYENSLNIMAEELINFKGQSNGEFSNETIIINGTFGPPCNAALIKAGRLILSDKETFEN